MKISKNTVVYTLFITAYVLFSSYTSTDEKLRIKIENISVSKQLSNVYNVYCVPSLRGAYLNNQFEKFWSSESQIEQFITVIANSSSDGLNPDDYHYSELVTLRNSSSEIGQLNFEVLMSDAFLLYCSHIINGKLNPKNIDPQWHVVKDETNPVPFLFELKDSSVNSIIEKILPKNRNYLMLKKELAALKEKKATELIKSIEKGIIIKKGDTDTRISTIRKRLMELEYVVNNADSDNYDEDLFNTIILFQADYGIESKGNIGNQTIDALNMTLDDKIAIVIANMERMRWLPITMPAYYVYVNIANYKLDIIKNNISVESHKVIVGKTARQTPVFSSTMSYVVFNPTWTVPPTILRKDVLPATRKNVSYLSGKNISVYTSDGEKLDPQSIDWNSNAVLGYTFRQDAGINNALGAVKFMFPNSFNIYLHDTPSRELFEKTERAFSSGCIRVHNPLKMAELLLNDPSRYSSKEIDAIVKEGKTITVLLKDKPGVFLLYQTAWANSDGKIVYRNDIYERDSALKQALNTKPAYDAIGMK